MVVLLFSPYEVVAIQTFSRNYDFADFGTWGKCMAGTWRTRRPIKQATGLPFIIGKTTTPDKYIEEDLSDLAKDSVCKCPSLSGNGLGREWGKSADITHRFPPSGIAVGRF